MVLSTVTVSVFIEICFDLKHLLNCVYQIGGKKKVFIRSLGLTFMNKQSVC